MQNSNPAQSAFEKLSDKELYKKCQKIGALTLKYRRQFLGMIPEVEKRKLYLQYGMHDICEFAAKLAGVSREVVNEILRIHRLLNNAPALQEKLVSGEISYTKLRSVATVATMENQEVWLKKVETMSRPTLEVYVREIKGQEERQRLGQVEGQTVWDEQPTEMLPIGCSLPWKEEEYETLSLKVNSKTAAKMRVFKRKLERKLRKPLDWNETLQEILTLAEGKTGRKTRKIAVETAGPSAAEAQSSQLPKHYMPAAVQNQVLEENQGICDAPGCNKPGEIFHHTERFALKPEHDPKKISYLCKPHERIAHHSLIKNEEESPENWQLLIEPDKNHPKYAVDLLVQKFRMVVNA